ncbi:MAG: hypothetical protein VKL02_09675 [Cylindrospermopsis raciborskii 1523720]|uniref:hypothetical protein n=1 Tax=Cylindrospermopsis raciborskii TaxID=77022 RepID=UPI001F34CADB|nr:hypothetical protein [Cylindrospermopsis raciborskii]MEB3146391.1 hypothetical protein [Cylindrospermopsis raciborskii]UJS05571.1 hypothetical protein L3I90_04855 [Cylindrospermopsis raciborskii KLL07]
MNYNCGTDSSYKYTNNCASLQRRAIALSPIGEYQILVVLKSDSHYCWVEKTQQTIYQT